jgi:hypothetical protein
MQPDLIEAFIDEFTAAWKLALAQTMGNADQHNREMQIVERRIGNLIDALADGVRAPDIQKRLDDLEQRRAASGPVRPRSYGSARGRPGTYR